MFSSMDRSLLSVDAENGNSSHRPDREPRKPKGEQKPKPKPKPKPDPGEQKPWE